MKIKPPSKTLPFGLVSSYKPFSFLPIFLAPEFIRDLFTQLTGLEGAPKVIVRSVGSGFKATLAGFGFDVSGRKDQQVEVGCNTLFQAIHEELDKHCIAVKSRDNLKYCLGKFCWIEGILKKTRFPADIESLEIANDSFRALLCCDSSDFTPLFRNYLRSGFFKPVKVRALVFVNGVLRESAMRQERNSQSTSTVSAWLPATPVAIFEQKDPP